jgi:hypothetical protein
MRYGECRYLSLRTTITSSAIPIRFVHEIRDEMARALGSKKELLRGWFMVLRQDLIKNAIRSVWKREIDARICGK